MYPIFDTHAHYDDAAFDPDRGELLEHLPAEGIVGVVCPGVNVASSRACIELAEKYPFIRAAAGIHPSDVGAATEEDLAAIAALCDDPAVVAVGEIGLDYHYDDAPREVQRAWFERQTALAVEKRLPVIVHDREAHEDTMTILRRYRPQGVIHCFSGSVEMMREAVALGLYIGLGGAVTFRNARKPLEVAAAVPLDRLLFETDAPYMAPMPYRGQRNTSGYIAEVIAAVAAVRSEPAEVIAAAAAENARTFVNR